MLNSNRTAWLCILVLALELVCGGCTERREQAAGVEGLRLEVTIRRPLHDVSRVWPRFMVLLRRGERYTLVASRKDEAGRERILMGGGRAGEIEEADSRWIYSAESSWQPLVVPSDGVVRAEACGELMYFFDAAPKAQASGRLGLQGQGDRIELQGPDLGINEESYLAPLADHWWVALDELYETEKGRLVIGKTDAIRAWSCLDRIRQIKRMEVEDDDEFVDYEGEPEPLPELLSVPTGQRLVRISSTGEVTPTNLPLLASGEVRVVQKVPASHRVNAAGAWQDRVTGLHLIDHWGSAAEINRLVRSNGEASVNGVAVAGARVEPGRIQFAVADTRERSTKTIDLFAPPPTRVCRLTIPAQPKDAHVLVQARWCVLRHLFSTFSLPVLRPERETILELPTWIEVTELQLRVQVGGKTTIVPLE